jgi:hypothetical protein
VACWTGDYEFGVIPFAGSLICGKNRPICGQQEQIGKKTKD